MGLQGVSSPRGRSLAACTGPWDHRAPSGDLGIERRAEGSVQKERHRAPVFR